jgi:hypothetical protein
MNRRRFLAMLGFGAALPVTAAAAVAAGRPPGEEVGMQVGPLEVTDMKHALISGCHIIYDDKTSKIVLPRDSIISHCIIEVRK